MIGFLSTTHYLTKGNGLDCITNCLTDNSRKSLYFFNGAYAWLIHLINPNPVYNKINPSPVR